MIPSIENTPSVAISLNRAPRASCELGLQVGHVVVLVAKPLGLAEPDAVDDRGVVQLVGDHRILGPQDRLEQAAVGVPAGRVEDRVFRAEELGDRSLQLLVGLLRAADEADRRHAVAPAIEGLVRRRGRPRGDRPGRGSCSRTCSGHRPGPATPTWACWGVVSTRSPFHSPAERISSSWVERCCCKAPYIACALSRL